MTRAESTVESTVPYRLVVDSDENKGMVFPLRGRSITVGRGPQNTIQVIDTRMSRIHTRLDRGPGGWVARDLQSKNGTFVNANLISGSVQLNPGDTLQIGNTLFVYEADIATPEEPGGGMDSGVKLVDDEDLDLETSHVVELDGDDGEKEISKVTGVPGADKERLRSIYQIGALIQSILDVDELLNKVMEIVVQVLHPTQACVMLHDKERDSLVPKVVIRPDGSVDDIMISGSVIHQAMEERVAVLMSDGLKDQRFKQSESIIAHRIHSAICAPMISKGEVFGALYLDLRGPGRPYGDADLEWAAGVAGQAALALAVSRLHAELMSRHAQEREMEIARGIQTNLLPKTSPRIDGFEFHGVSRPARMVGGDYFEMMELETGDYAWVLADVSGKGVPAAILLAAFRSAFRIQARDLSPGNLVEVVERLNENICREAQGNDMFITMVLGCLEPAARRLTYCNAGHVYPLLLRPGGEVEELSTGGGFLGIMASMAYESATVELPPGSVLAGVTDGVQDAPSPEGEPFGAEGFRSFLTANAALDAEEFCAALEAKIAEHQNGAEPFDDVTITVLKSLPEE